MALCISIVYFFLMWVYYMNVSPFVYLFTCKWIYGLFPFGDIMINAADESLWRIMFSILLASVVCWMVAPKRYNHLELCECDLVGEMATCRCD